MLYWSLGLVLMCFWLVMSGQFDNPLLVTIGVVSVLGVVALSRRMGIADEEGHPIHLSFRAVTYWPWLGIEIAKSGWDVTKIILNPKLPISPTLIRVHASQRTPVGLATYANSITLTPGTVTARVSGDEFLVHAITRSGAEDLAKGVMDRRVKEFEGGK